MLSWWIKAYYYIIGVYHITGYPKSVIDIFNVSDIKGYIIDVNLIMGAGMPLSEMMELFLKLSSENEDFAYLKEFYDHVDLVAHYPVRNVSAKIKSCSDVSISSEIILNFIINYCNHW